MRKTQFYIHSTFCFLLLFSLFLFGNAKTGYAATKTPTATANGSMRFVCEDCGLIKNQTIYFTSENEASPTDFVLPIIIGIIIVLVIAIVVVVIVIIRRRKR